MPLPYVNVGFSWHRQEVYFVNTAYMYTQVDKTKYNYDIEFIHHKLPDGGLPREWTLG